MVICVHLAWGQPHSASGAKLAHALWSWSGLKAVGLGIASLTIC